MHIQSDLLDAAIIIIAGKSLEYVVLKVAAYIDSKNKTWLDTDE